MVEITISESSLRNFLQVGKEQVNAYLMGLQYAIEESEALLREKRTVKTEADLVIGSYFCLGTKLKDIGLREPMAKSYSLYAGSRAAIERLNGAVSIHKESVDLNVGINFNARDFFIVKEITESMKRNITHGYGLEGLVNRFSKALYELNDAAYRHLLENKAPNSMNIRVLNVQINDRERVLDNLKDLKKLNKTISRKKPLAPKERKSAEDHEFHPAISEAEDDTKYSFDEAEFDDIVGNDALKRKLAASINDLLAYDETKKINPVLYEPNEDQWVKREVNTFTQRYLLYGRGGTGKTLTVRAAFTHAKRLAEKNNIGIKFVDPTKVFNSYVHGSKQNLEQFFNEIDAGETKFGIFIDEIDNYIIKRGADHSTSADYKEILGTLMRWLGGNTKNLGNYVLIATTNNPNGLDTNLKERFQHGTYLVEGPTKAAEYIKLLRDIKFKKSVQRGLISVRDWNRIGNELERHNASGRDVDDLYSKLTHSMDTRKRPEKFYEMDAIEKANAVTFAISCRITDNDFLQEIENHFASKKQVGAYVMK